MGPRPLLLFLALAAGLAWPGSAEARLTPAAERNMDDGIRNLYSLDYQASRKAFRRIISEEPANPFGYLAEAGAIWWQAAAEYGLFKGTPTLQGRAVVAQLGPLEFLVSGFDASVSFTLPAAVLQQTPNLQLEILRAEEGKYVNGVWQTTRILNGDQTDRGLNFRSSNPPLVRILLHTLPLYDEALHRKAE